MTEEETTESTSSGPSRRAMIGTGAVASAIGIAGGFTAGRATAAEPTKGAPPPPSPCAVPTSPGSPHPSGTGCTSPPSTSPRRRGHG
uniref:Uncharacterized protein n=1 Tax=Janibacter limosus TaxID=53458 RepID=A0AC61U1F8_9MICO|nr:hypothetical protein [Janibacter limosus]